MDECNIFLIFVRPIKVNIWKNKTVLFLYHLLFQLICGISYYVSIPFYSFLSAISQCPVFLLPIIHITKDVEITFYGNDTCAKQFR